MSEKRQASVVDLAGYKRNRPARITCQDGTVVTLRDPEDEEIAASMQRHLDAYQAEVDEAKAMSAEALLEYLGRYCQTPYINELMERYEKLALRGGADDEREGARGAAAGLTRDHGGLRADRSDDGAAVVLVERG